MKNVHHRAHRAHGALLVENETGDSVNQPPDVEVDQQPDSNLAQFQIREYLGLMDSDELVDGFHLNNHAVSYPKVQAIGKIDCDTTVSKRQRNLAFDPQALKDEVDCQTSLIRAFKQAWSQSPVNVDSASDNGLCHRIDLSEFLLSVTSVVSVVRIGEVAA